jgi:tRNA-splicing ligase RtcB
MKPRQLENLGVPAGAMVRLAIRLIGPAIEAGLPRHELRPRLKAVVEDPAAHTGDPHFGELARAMVEPRTQVATPPRREPAPWKQFGIDLDPASIAQMQHACQLPVAVRGALMPDAHVGYGLPIGGVLAADNAVIPYAVGVDIACRVKISVLDLPAKALESQNDRLARALEEQTRFGVGAEFRKRHSHPVLDEDWNATGLLRHLRDKAHAQLGTSGSGNHFVEFGTLTLAEPELGLEPGTYLALMSHSGSRGPGASICSHYSQVAMNLRRDLPRELRHLAWLDLDSEEGQGYWQAMQLMGQYAAANHAIIHDQIARHLGARLIAGVENHHNFAWLEEHDGKQVVVHRKGATPAQAGQLGVIPGSMASPAYIVRGLGDEASLQSAAHGAGRVMSRTEAKKMFRWSDVNRLLNARNVRLLSAGLDEVPFVYKDIDEVMAQQPTLVRSVARFEPRIVKMAPAGERAED